jgi:kynurenine formamidase
VREIIDLNHVVANDTVTYPGLPAPSIGDHVSREASRQLYSPGYEFQIGTITMVASTGTYPDTPFHHCADGHPVRALAILE